MSAKDSLLALLSSLSSPRMWRDSWAERRTVRNQGPYLSVGLRESTGKVEGQGERGQGVKGAAMSGQGSHKHICSVRDRGGHRPGQLAGLWSLFQVCKKQICRWVQG